MGKTYKKQNTSFYEDEEKNSRRSGKHAKHSNNRKSGGMKTLNSYVDDDSDYDLNDDAFDDEIEFEEYVHIQHTKNTKL